MPKRTWIEWPTAWWQEETHCSITKTMIHTLLHLVKGCDTVMTVHLGVEICPELKSDDAEQPACLHGKISSVCCKIKRQTASGFSRLHSWDILQWCKENLTGIRSRLKKTKKKHGVLGRKRVSNGGSIPTEPQLCCFIPGGLIHWMCKDDSVTIGDQMGLTRGWKCKECLLNWCSRDEERGDGA